MPTTLPATGRQQLAGVEPGGGVAQLGEHLLCKQGVVGSNPIASRMPASALVFAGLPPEPFAVAAAPGGLCRGGGNGLFFHS